MIIPVKCYTCGKVLANKYRQGFVDEVRSRKAAKNQSIHKTTYLTTQNAAKTIEGDVLDELHLLDPCCRTIMLTHVDIL